MKTALCLHGYFGTLSTGDFTTAAGGYEHIKERVFSKVDSVDVFVHCWQPEFEEQIEKLYNPKQSIYEGQIDFDKVCKENGIDQDYIDEGFPREQTFYKNAVASRILSFYYSRCQSLKLALEGDYDWVITTRFDIAQRGGPEVNKIRFFPDSVRDYLYTTYWDQMNQGYGDMWFYGSPSIMKKYSSIYDRALDDFKPRSGYEAMVVGAEGGIPDSQFYNWYDTKDYRQFSNELIKPEEQRSETLMALPRWRLSDSHLYHKWFCMQNELYNKTRWV
tara:strand:+ start:10112 stop:10936 length:825 start_codon:yes stop_codon:yes gene_type:complete